MSGGTSRGTHWPHVATTRSAPPANASTGAFFRKVSDTSSYVVFSWPGVRWVLLFRTHPLQERAAHAWAARVADAPLAQLGQIVLAEVDGIPRDERGGVARRRVDAAEGL
eukprot:scaffold2741_cov134-Isochrysis_galbana.AAC.4